MNKITVLTVCYNSADTIGKTIESVKKQTYPNIEYVIVDGGSKDATIDIINEYKDKSFVVLSEPDKGIYDAINKGLKLATGDFLLVLGSDDTLIDEKTIENVVSFIEDKDTVYYGDIFRTIRNDRYCGKYNSYKLAVKNIPHQALFYPKSVYKVNTYKLEYRLFADYVYNIELWNNHKFQYIPVVVTNYYDGASSSTLEDKNFDNDYRRIVIDNIGRLQYYYASAYHYIRNIIKRGKR